MTFLYAEVPLRKYSHRSSIINWIIIDFLNKGTHFYHQTYDARYVHSASQVVECYLYHFMLFLAVEYVWSSVVQASGLSYPLLPCCDVSNTFWVLLNARWP